MPIGAGEIFSSREEKTDNHSLQMEPPVHEVLDENYDKSEQSDEPEYDDAVRYKDGTVKLRNRNIELMDRDVLYHLGLDNGTHDLVKMFGDVKFVCMGGTSSRMEQFANYMMNEMNIELPTGAKLHDITQHSCRYSMYKVGPVLSVSHGMGLSSISILLHELIKLMYHAKARDPIFIRIGTCGGIGLDAGTVVITEEGVDEMLRPYHESPVLGRLVRRPAKLDKKLTEELIALANPEDPYKTIVGKTMCASDFYEGQGRCDGCTCEFTEQDKQEYLVKLQKAGIKNVEMEATIFGAMTHYTGIRAAIVCVTFLDRLKGDQIMAPKEVLDEWQMRPQKLVSRLIKRELAKSGKNLNQT